MYEVILTYRPDFREKVIDRYPTEGEARTMAEQVSSRRPENVIRVWVRHTREVKTKP